MATPSNKEKRTRRHSRIRSTISGTASMPRVSVFRSNTALYVQLIDDETGKTLAAATTKGMKGKTGIERSREAGLELAKKAAALKVTRGVFDRGGFRYAGNVKALAEGVREGGLKV